MQAGPESPSLLVVDDEEDIKLVLRAALERDGYRVDTRCSPGDTLKSFAPNKYALLVCDIKMPETDGFTLAEKLLEIDNKMKVLFLTAFDEGYFEEFKRRFPNLPRHCYIKKPVSVGDLLDVVSTELNRSNS